MHEENGYTNEYHTLLSQKKFGQAFIHQLLCSFLGIDTNINELQDLIIRLAQTSTQSHIFG